MRDDVEVSCRTCAIELAVQAREPVALAGDLARFFVEHEACRTTIDLHGRPLPAPVQEDVRLRPLLRIVPPPAPAAFTGALHVAAQSARTTGRLGEARQIVDEGLAAVGSSVARAELLALRSRLDLWSGPVRPAVWLELCEAAERVAGQAPALAAEVLCDAATAAAVGGDLRRAERYALRALDLSDGKGVAGALAATGVGILHAISGRVDSAAPLLGLCVELLDAGKGVVEAAELLHVAVLALVVQERYEEAVSAAAGFLTAARAVGAVGLLPLPLCLLAHAAWLAGRWEESRLAAAEALALAGATRESTLELYAEALLTLIAGAQGRDAGCRSRAAQVLELGSASGVGVFAAPVQAALVHLLLGLDRPQEALRPLAELTASAQGAALLPWQGDCVDVLVRLGRLDEARVVVQELEQQAGSRWPTAVLLRCRGQLEPEHVAAFELLAASVEAFAWHPYEQARSRLRLAQRMADAGHTGAAEQAVLAQQAFLRLRARGWSEQASRLVSPPVAVPDPTPVPSTAAFEVQLLGGFAVLRNGQPLAIPPGMGCQAVKFVATRGGRTTVDELVEALWPDAEPGRGRTRLRNVLTRLRHDGDLLVRHGDEVALPASAVCDLATFLEQSAAALAAGDVVLARAAVERHAGELLPGDRYQDWTSGPRERVRMRYLQLLDLLAANASEQGRLDEALSFYERALDADPYDEDRYRTMVQLLLAHDRTGPAHRVARRALAMLDRLGVPASDSLVALADVVLVAPSSPETAGL